MKVKQQILFCITATLLNACGGAQIKKHPPTRAGSDVQKEFAQIQVEMASGAQARAVQRLKKLIAQHPNTDTADDATMYLANYFYSGRNYEQSYQAYMSVINSDVFSANSGEALLGAARCLSKLGRYDEALSLTERSVRIPGLSEKTLLDNYRLRLNLFSDMGDRLDSLKTAVYLTEHDTDAGIRESARLKAIDMVESRLTEAELDRVTQNPDFGFVRVYGFYRMGLIAVENRDYSKARSDFQKVIDLNTAADLSEKAQGAISQIDARRQVDTFTIGAILPLSGKYANVGARTLKGLQLGLGIFGSDRSDFRLAVQDEEGTSDSARRAVEKLVTEDHVMAIVGSLLSRTAVAVANKAEELGVPSVGLSQKTGLTEVGRSVFRNSITSQMQLRSLVRLAMENLGITKFAILYPNDAYGVESANIFWDEVLARGGQIVGAQIYEPNETDFSSHMERLVGRYYVEDREDEYKFLLRDWAKKQKTISARKSIPEDLLPPIVDFQALFVPDSVKALGQIAPMLAYQNIKDVRLLGTNLWNTDALITRGERHVEKALFVDSLFASDPEFRNSRFFREFRRVYGEDPGLFEVQGYDTGLMLRQIIASGERSRVGLAEKLARLQNFPGALGPLVMTEQREVYRQVVPLTVQKGQIVRFTDTPTTSNVRSR